MVTANQALKAVGLFIAYLLKSITDLFLTKPLWASLKVLEDTDLRATGGSKNRVQNTECFISKLIGKIVSKPDMFVLDYRSPGSV